MKAEQSVCTKHNMHSAQNYKFWIQQECMGTSRERSRLPKGSTYIPEIHLLWAKYIYSFNILFIAFNAALMESNLGVTASKMKISVFFRERPGKKKELNIFWQRKILL